MNTRIKGQWNGESSRYTGGFIDLFTRLLEFDGFEQNVVYKFDVTVLFTICTWKRPSSLLPTTCKQFQFYSETYSLEADAALFVD